MFYSKADAALLEFKPQVPQMTDYEWVVIADAEGIAPALARCFWNWFKAQGIALWNDEITIFSALFGEVGFKAYILSGRESQAFDAVLLAQEWRAEHLGIFGKWAVSAGVEAHMNNVLKAALTYMYTQSQSEL